MSYADNWGGAARQLGPSFTPQPNTLGQLPGLTFSSNTGPYFNNGELSQKPSKDAVLPAYFGMSTSKEPEDPYDAYDIENYQLPDGFKGKRPYMKFIIIRGVSTADQYPYREMFPLTREETSQEICWDVWKFNNHMLGRTPEESVSRMLTMNVSQSRESMIRQGIALMLEHGFYMTEKGQLNYRMNMQQIMHATATTLAQGAMLAAIMAQYDDPNDKYRKKQSRGLLQIARCFRDELSNFAIIQKSQNGWKVIFDKCKQALIDRNGKPGDYTVVPAGTRKYIEGRPENNTFLLNGIPGGVRTDVMPHNGVLRESVGYRTSEHEPNDDVCIRTKTIGGFLQLPIPEVPVEKFTRSMYGTYFFNEDKDDYSYADYGKWMQDCYIFDWREDGKPLTDHGRKFFDHVPGDIDKPVTWGSYFKFTNIYEKIITKLLLLNARDKAEFIRLATGQVNGRGTDPDALLSQSSLNGLHSSSNITQQIVAMIQQMQQAAFAAPDASLESITTNTHSAFDQLKRQANKSVSDTEIEEYAGLVKQMDAVTVVTRLLKGKKESSYTSLLSHFNDAFKFVNSLPGVSTDKLDSLALKMQPYVMDYELKESVVLLQDSDSMPPIDEISPIERLISQGVTDLSKLVEANKISPNWAVDGPRSVLSSPHANSGTTVPLNSYIFTLASKHIVLLNLSPEEVDSHIANKGVAQTNFNIIAANPDTVDLSVDLKRFSFLQLSVTISAIYSAILTVVRQIQESHISSTDVHFDQRIKDMVKRVTDCCGEGHPSNKSDVHQYGDDLRMYAKYLKPMLAQYCLGNIAMQIRDFVVDYVDNRTKDVSSIVKGIYDTISAAYVPMARTSPYHLHLDDTVDPTFSGDASFLMLLKGSSIFTPLSLSVRAQRATVDKTDDDALRSYQDAETALLQEATQKLTNLMTTMVAADKKTKPAFKDHEKNFIALYVINEKTGKKLDWELAVRTLVDLYIGGDAKKALAADWRDRPNQENVSRLLQYLVRGKPIPSSVKTPEQLVVAAFKAGEIPSSVTERETINTLRQTALSVLHAKSKKSTSADKAKFSKTLPTTGVAINEFAKNYEDLFADEQMIPFMAIAAFGRNTKKSYIPKNDATGYLQAVKSPSENELLVLMAQMIRDYILRVKIREQSATLFFEELYTSWSVVGGLKARIQGVFGGNIPTLLESFLDLVLKPANTRTPADIKDFDDKLDALKLTEDTPFEVLVASDSVDETQLRALLDNFIIEDGLFVEFGILKDLWPFFSFLYFRPHMRYLMGTMIHMNAYGVAGKTYYGWADFQLADNVAQKTHYGHFTMYAKTIVLHPEYIVQGHNIICKDYEGGNGESTWNPNDPDHIISYKSNDLEYDGFVAPCYPEYQVPNWFLDISGRFNDTLYPNEEAKRACNYGPSADILSALWGWRAVISPLNRDHYTRFTSKFNTLVFQDHQKLYNPATGKYDRIIINQGHWGSRVYPKCGEVRRGQEMFFADVDYDNTRGRFISV